MHLVFRHFENNYYRGRSEPLCLIEKSVSKILHNKNESRLSSKKKRLKPECYRNDATQQLSVWHRPGHSHERSIKLE